MGIQIIICGRYLSMIIENLFSYALNSNQLSSIMNITKGISSTRSRRGCSIKRNGVKAKYKFFDNLSNKLQNGKEVKLEVR